MPAIQYTSIGAATGGGGGGGGADALGTYIVKRATNAPVNAQILAALTTGLLKVTTTTGVLSTAAGGTDYALPSVDMIAGAGLTGGGTLAANRTFNIGQNADSSITVNANDIQLSSTLQTAISTNTSDISTLGTTVSGHTTTLGLLAAPKYIVQQASSDLTNEQALGALATGLLKSTTTTGVLSIAASGTDYADPAVDMIAGSGLTGGGTLAANRTFNIGQNADNSITVNANDIQLSTALQTTISTNTSNIATNASDIAGLRLPKYIVQQASSDLTNEQSLGALATGLLKSTTTTGVLSIAAAGTDYADPAIIFTAGAGLTGGGTLAANRTFTIGQNADNSITVNADDIQLSTTLQTAISTNTSNISSLTTTVSGHTTTLGLLAAPKYIVQQASSDLTNEQALGALATGILKSTTSTGVLSIATASDIPSVLTTKGDVATFSTVPNRLAVGADGFVLTADAASTNGIKWAAGGGGSGADALGTYIVQTSTNAPANAQLLASLATGMLKVATTTGVLTSFAATTDTFPVGASGVLADSPLTQASNVLKYTVSASGLNVGIYASNTNTSASSTCRLEARVAGASTGNPGLTLGITGGSDWTFDLVNATNDKYQISKAASPVFEIDPIQTYKQFSFAGLGTSLRNLHIGSVAASGDGIDAGVVVTTSNVGSAEAFTLLSDVGGSSGRIICATVRVGATAWKKIWSGASNSAVSFPILKLVEQGGQATFLGSNTLASASGLVWDAFDHQASTLTLSGSTSVTTATGLNYIDFKTPTITSGSSLTVTNAATLRIAAAPAQAGSTTITNPYALWIDAGATRLDGNIDLSADAQNVILGSTTGTKVGTATTQKLGFWNATPVVQPAATGVTTTGFSANASANAVFAESTVTGGVGATAYTLSDIVKNLKAAGLLAQ